VTKEEHDASLEAAWGRVAGILDLLEVVIGDLRTAVKTRSPTRLSGAAQSFSKAGFDLIRLLGRIEEGNGE
jgi:hypothetical protein